jgi:hypothetical protein
LQSVIEIICLFLFAVWEDTCKQKYCWKQCDWNYPCCVYNVGFTYRLDRLKPRASKFRRPLAKVYNIFNTAIGLSHLCCHSVLYFLNNPSVIFLTQLHSISEYCRILNTPHHLHLNWNWLSTLPSCSSREGGGLGGASHVE